MQRGAASWPAKHLRAAVMTPEGDKRVACVLDDAADVNVISEAFARKAGLKKLDIALPDMEGFRGDKGSVYGAYRVRMRLADSTGEDKLTEETFFGVDLKGPEILLGRPWRRQYGVIVDSRDDYWWYARKDERHAVHMREPSAFYRDMQKATTVFAVRAVSSTEIDLPSELEEYRDVFPLDDEPARPLPEGVEHAIDLEPGQRPPFRPLYNLSATELKALRDYLDKALANGWIKRSASEAGAPILFVPKKDGSLRLCVDYRGLNAISIKNRHPLPLISETLDRLGGASVFSKLDLKDAYYRIPIRPSDCWKTAFRTRYGHFEYQVMPFGLTNAPATFQGYINRALAGLVDCFCVVYLDDILIYSNSREEHVRHLCEVLSRLRKFGLYASRKKCDFFVTEVEFLGYMVSTAGVSMDTRRVATIQEWPEPKSFKDVQVFLGFANFYRRFIRHYSKIVAPLTALTKGAVRGKKPGPIAWDAPEAHAFCQVKEAFASAPLLRHYEPSAKIRMETDASKFAISAIVSQLLPEGDAPAQWHPIAFWSRKLIAAELNYETHDSELLAIVEGFKEFRHYLEGASHAIEVLTDHNNLRGFMGVKQLNGRQARWATFLASFDFTIEHRAGKSNPADAPSRRPDYAGAEHATRHLLPTLQNKLAVWENDVGLAPIVGRVRARESHDLPLRAASEATEYIGPTVMVRAIVNAASGNENAYQAPSEGLASLMKHLQEQSAELKELRGTDVPAGEALAWQQDNGLWYYNDKLYVPDDSALRAELMRVHHDDELAGHFGGDKTEALLRRKYWWPTLSRDVRDRVKSCKTCQTMKSRRHRPYGEAQALRMPNRPWQEITMDFITDLPPVKKNGVEVDAILVIVDRYSKMNVYVPTTKRCDSVELAIILRDYVVRHYGMPEGILTDRGSVFTSQYWSDFAFEAQVKHKLSTAFHPQTDGQTERMNQTLEQYLRCYCSENQTEWADRLSQAEFAVNNSLHHALRMSPFEILYGFNPEIHTAPARDELHEGEVPAATERARTMRDTDATLRERWKKAQESQVRNQDNRQKPMTYNVGDLVLLSTKNLRLAVPKKKMGARFVGPFRIRDAVGSQAYRLSLPTSYRIHNVFHVSLLEPYHQRAGEEPDDPMPLAVQEDEYEVESILDSKVRKKKRFYLVRWRGYPEEYTSWQPAENCENAVDAIRAYEERAKNKRGRRS